MKENIKKYIKILNKDNIDEELLDYSIEEVISRTKIYLNRKDIPDELERLLASVVNNVFKLHTNNKDNKESSSFVNSISDNGQSVSYSNELVNYFMSSDDNELFGGITKLLNRYRRVTVVTPEKL